MTAAEKQEAAPRLTGAQQFALQRLYHDGRSRCSLATLRRLERLGLVDAGSRLTGAGCQRAAADRAAARAMAAGLADPAGEAVEEIIGTIVHELRRAERGPIPQICAGGIAPYHQAAVDWGWLAPGDSEAWRGYLALTPIGREMLRQAGPPAAELSRFPVARRA